MSDFEWYSGPGQANCPDCQRIYFIEQGHRSCRDCRTLKAIVTDYARGTTSQMLVLNTVLEDAEFKQRA